MEDPGAVVLTFGKHKGERIEDVPLRYLDWLVDQDWLFPDVKQAVKAYLAKPNIKRELERELES